MIYPHLFPESRKNEHAEKKVFERLEPLKDYYDIFYNKSFISDVEKEEFEIDFIIAEKADRENTCNVIICLEVKGGIVEYDGINNIWLQNESVIILQIEHIDALNNLDEILSLSDVDAIMIGPYDFSGSIGIPGDFKHKKYLNNLNLILKKSKKYKKTIGIHSISTNPNDCKDYIKQGYKFIACSLDTIFLMNSIKNYFTLLNKKTNE